MAQETASFIVFENFAFRTSIGIIGDGFVPPTVFAYIGDIGIGVHPFHFIQCTQLIIAFHKIHKIEPVTAGNRKNSVAGFTGMRLGLSQIKGIIQCDQKPGFQLSDNFQFRQILFTGFYFFQLLLFLKKFPGGFFCFTAFPDVIALRIFQGNVFSFSVLLHILQIEIISSLVNGTTAVGTFSGYCHIDYPP